MSHSPPHLRHLRHVSLDVVDLDAAVDFYDETWGLERLDDPDADRALFRATGPEHHVLRLNRGDRPRLDHLSFAVADEAEVDAAAEWLRANDVGVTRAPGRLDEPGGGYGLRFVDLEGRSVELSAGLASVAPRSPEAPVPMRLSHVVLNTVDIDAACDFWVRLLGLRVSDWSEHQMVFLRCNAEHHCLAFNQAEWTAVNHVAYLLPGLDEFMRSIGRAKRRGVEPIWGPGRHGPGSNPFAYYADGVGFVPEFTTDIEQVDETTWVPRVWQRVPEQSDLWGTAGPPSADARRHMAGRPERSPS